MRVLALFVVFAASLVVGCADSSVVQCGNEDGASDAVDATGSPLGGGQGGGSNAGPVVCEPGAAYVCKCEDDSPSSPNLGNKFCSWDGASFGPCELCGEGPVQMGVTDIGCNLTEPSSPLDPPVTQCPDTSGVCWGYQCDNVKKKCVQYSFIEGSVLQDVSPNDCYRPRCDGLGAVVLTPDPTDCVGSCDASGLCVQ